MAVLGRLLRNNVPPLPPEISEEQHLSFLRQCLSFQPADRPSADQILAFLDGELLHSVLGTPQTAEATAVGLLNLFTFTFKLISISA